MNILHVVQLYAPVASGAGRYFREIGERLVSEGHSVTVLATDAYDLEHFWAGGKRRVAVAEEVLGGVRVVRLAVRRLPGPPLLYPIIRRLMVELSRLPGSTPLLRRLALLTPRLPALAQFFATAGRFDLVHTTNITLDFAVLPALAYARQVGAAFLCTPFVHLGEPGNPAIVRYYSMRHQLEVLRQSAYVLTMTGLESDFLVARGVARARLRRVGVGVNPPEATGGDPARFRAAHQIDGPLILSIGALARDKGMIDLLEAFGQLVVRYPSARLVLIGAPLSHFSSYFERLPASLRAATRLLPYADEQTKRDALAAATLFAMPSRTDSFGITYLEAWCNYLPVIGARAGGVPDVIADGTDGLLVRFGDPAELATAISRLLDDRVLAAKLGAAGYAKVQHEYTWERVYAKVRAVYGEAVRGATEDGRRT